MDRLKGLREKLPSRDQISSTTSNLRERASSLSTSSSGSSSSDSRFSLQSVKSYIPGQESSSRRESIVARPISSLPDVSHFGPPPKRVLAPPPPLNTDSQPSSVPSSPATPTTPSSPATRRPPPPVPARKPAPPLPVRRSNTISGPHPFPVATTFRSTPSPLSASPAPAPPAYTENAPTTGTTWEQKHHALQTATKFQRDPTSVSYKDLQSAVGTARNFQQRNGSEVAAAAGRAEGLAQRAGYDVGGVVGKKAPPPPPPPRMRERPMSMSAIPTPPSGTPPLPGRPGAQRVPPPLPPRRPI